jgi:hypothetical protein
MSLDRDIRRALEKRLSALSGIPTIAYENVSFEPASRTAFCRTKYFPISERPVGTGANAIIEARGQYLIDVFYPQNDNGPLNADVAARSIIDHFPRGLFLSENSKTVRILTSERRGAIPIDSWYVVPVIVTWYCYITE